MTSLKILNNSETKKILDPLKEQFEIKEIPGKLVTRGVDRIFLFTGKISDKELLELEKNIPIERAGVYFAKWENEQIRLSIEGTQILGKQIKKNIFELESEEQVETWMSGQELQFADFKDNSLRVGGGGLVGEKIRGIVVIKYKEHLLGCGKASENKITNFIPKNRRLKLKTVIQ